jgi:tetratricopeptide (TPR) repeat protein
MKQLLYISLFAITLFSCQTETKNKITQADDYNQFLNSEAPKTSSKYFDLWNSKIKPDSIQLTSFGVVAGQYEAYFKATGDIEYLKKAEQALEKAVEIAAVGRAGFRRALARNYISQHRFKEALVQAENAREIGAGLEETQSLLFDVHLELGNYTLAKNYLDSITDLNNFGFLIRAAKWNDYKGDLTSTINYMEQATKKAENMKNEGLRLWAYTNLADYYGHAGNIKESYQLYLKALHLDNQNAYAKKGIAWIVFSYERNPKEALRILDAVTKNYSAPDIYLLKSEIADFMGDRKVSSINLDVYFASVKNPKYGDMYNAYNINLFLNETNHLNKALQLSEREVANRPTPESYHFLASSYLKLGDKEKALQIVENYIEGKTFEPSILFTVAEIYKVNGKNNQVKVIKEDLSEAIYELGPSMKSKIEAL